MITEYGMSDRFRNMALTSRGAGNYLGDEQEPLFQREYAESTQQYVDEEIARIMEKELAKASGILQENRAVLEKVARVLLEKETIDEKEFRALIGKTEG
jgi:cell division protease FtsH